MALFEYVRNVLDTYAAIIGRNRRVIEATVFWFRLALSFSWVLFVPLTGFIYVGDAPEPATRNGILVVTALSVGIGYYVLPGGYLPLEDGGDDDE